MNLPEWTKNGWLVAAILFVICIVLAFLLVTDKGKVDSLLSLLDKTESNLVQVTETANSLERAVEKGAIYAELLNETMTFVNEELRGARDSTFVLRQYTLRLNEIISTRPHITTVIHDTVIDGTNHASLPERRSDHILARSGLLVDTLHGDTTRIQWLDFAEVRSNAQQNTLTILNTEITLPINQLEIHHSIPLVVWYVIGTVVILSFAGGVYVGS